MDFNILKGVLLLFIILMSGFLEDGLSEGFKRSVQGSLFLKHLLAYMTIYFTLDFSHKRDLPPREVAYKSLAIYIVFIMFQKTTIWATIPIFVLLATLYVIEQQIQFNKTDAEIKGTPKRNKKLKKYSRYVYYAIMGFLIIGFISYFNKQKLDHGDDFSLIKFLSPTGTGQ